MRYIPRQPQWTRFLPERAVVHAATLGPLGRWPAPGTWGTAAGILWFAIAIWPAGPVFGWLLMLAGLYAAFALCGEAEKRMQRIDPPEVILDEFFSVPLAFIGLGSFLATPQGWVVALLVFAIFRFFDIAKPLGIRSLQRFPGGAGVLFDDVAAALATCAVVHVIVRFTPLIEWVAP